jgi:hypothetical protein
VIDLPQPTGSNLWPTEEPDELTPLHRPRRAFVTVAEVIVAGVAIWFAFVLWHGAAVTLTTTLTDGTRLISTRYFGNRVAGAIGLGLLAALLLIDAVRQLLLATRPKRRKVKQRSTGFSQPTPS